MKFEKLKVGDSYGKKMFLYGILVSFFLIILISIFTSRAKYRLTESVKIVDSVVSYSPYDFKIMEIYKQKEGSNCTDINGDTCYDKLSDTERMPGEGYVLNTTNSYCNLSTDSKDEEAILTSNEAGEIVISGLTVKDKCYLYYDKEKNGKELIVDNSSVIDETPHFDGTACLTDCTYQENGLYKTEDDFGESYYFRGTVEDNWVKFGTDSDQKAIYWRIIRVNGDGSIRLIYSGIDNPKINGDDTQIGKFSFNSKDDDNLYVGFQYTSGNMHGYGINVPQSNALTELKKWFVDNLLDEWNEGNGFIDVNAGFCNDRSKSTNNKATWSEYISDNSSTGNSKLYYGAYLRLITSKQPTLKCSTIANKDKDFFTYTNASTGTKSLQYPVGLIISDEVAFAGGRDGINNKGYWLYTDKDYWTMSPYTSINANVFWVSVNGAIGGNYVYAEYGLRPVINLKSDTKFTFTDPDQPKGTSTNPYIVVE